MQANGLTPCVVLGAGGHARVVLGVLQDAFNRTRYAVIAAIDPAGPRAAGENILGVPVVSSWEEVSAESRQGCRTAFIAVGDNARRKGIYQDCKVRGFDLPTLVSEHALIAPSATLGEANFVAPFAHIGPLTSLGDNNLINTQANIEHDSYVGSHVHVAPGAVLLGGCRVADECMIGSRAVLLEKTSIANHSVIGAGAVITRAIERPGMVVVGVPGRVIE